MIVVALVIAWVVAAAVLALVVGRGVAVAQESDRWRHGQREVRDPNRLHQDGSKTAAATERTTHPATPVERSAADAPHRAA